MGDDCNYFDEISKKYFNECEAEDLFERLQSFLFYCGEADHIQSALSGFQFSHKLDYIFCDECYLHLKDLTDSDNPMYLHELINPNCVYVIKFAKYFTHKSDSIEDDRELISRCLVTHYD